MNASRLSLLVYNWHTRSWQLTMASVAGLCQNIQQHAVQLTISVLERVKKPPHVYCISTDDQLLIAGEVEKFPMPSTLSCAICTVRRVLSRPWVCYSSLSPDWLHSTGNSTSKGVTDQPGGRDQRGQVFGVVTSLLSVTFSDSTTAKLAWSALGSTVFGDGYMSRSSCSSPVATSLVGRVEH